MTEVEKVAQRRRSMLQAWMGDRNLNQVDVAKLMGVGKAYVSLLLRPNKRFGERAARAMEAKLGMPSGYLDMADDGPAAAEWSDVSQLSPDMYALVPHISIAIKDGNPVGVPQELPALALPVPTLKSRGVTKRDKLRLVRMPDSSMEPGLEEGDLVLVDMGQAEPRDGDVYALRYGDRVILRRVFSRADGGIRLQPTNPAFPPEDVQPGPNVAILGMRVWRGG